MMGRSSTRVFLRDDKETELEVHYSCSGGSEPSGLFGPPEDYDPGSGMEVEIEDCYLLSQRDSPKPDPVELTDAERERFEQEVNEDPATWEMDDDYDY